MKLDNMIASMIKESPTLFNGPDAESSRVAVLSFLFLVLGNGYGWTSDGYLADAMLWESKWWESGDKFGYLVIGAPPYGSYGQEHTLEEIEFVNTARLKEFKPYSEFETAAIGKIPETIQDDWLEGALEIAKLSLEYYRPDTTPEGISKFVGLWLIIEELLDLQSTRIEEHDEQRV